MSAATATANRVATRSYIPWSVADSLSPLESKLEPALEATDFQRIADDPEWQQLERVRCELDPWYYRVNYVVTQDEHWVSKGLTSAYRRWPSRPHLQSYTYVLWRYPFTAWPKSRQQMVTWLIATQMHGDAIFTGGRLYMIQSKRWPDSKKVLNRVRGVDARLRAMAPWLVPALVKDEEAELGWANGSNMMAVPEGAHYVQSHTPAWWFPDELQLQAEAKEAFEQAAPACERISMVGTADYAWFYQTFLADKQEREVA